MNERGVDAPIYIALGHLNSSSPDRNGPNRSQLLPLLSTRRKRFPSGAESMQIDPWSGAGARSGKSGMNEATGLSEALEGPKVKMIVTSGKFEERDRTEIGDGLTIGAVTKRATAWKACDVLDTARFLGSLASRAMYSSISSSSLISDAAEDG